MRAAWELGRALPIHPRARTRNDGDIAGEVPKALGGTMMRAPCLCSGGNSTAVAVPVTSEGFLKSLTLWRALDDVLRIPNTQSMTPALGVSDPGRRFDPTLQEPDTSGVVGKMLPHTLRDQVSLRA